MSATPNFVRQYIRASAIIFFLFTEAVVVVEIIKHMK
jgi:hypothetical protein